jgi:ABC-2 type transport system permease protein
MTLLAAMPVIITVIMLHDETAGSVTDFERAILGAMLAGSIAPLVVLAIAAAAFGHEVEDRTLANHTISPVPRWKIVLPKLLATITIAGPFIALSAFLTAHVAFIVDWPATIAVTVSAIVGVAMYASLLVWVGLVCTQAIGVGLLYIVLWEGFFAGFVSGARMLSIRYYAIAIMHAIDPRRFAGLDHVSGATAAMVAAAVVGGFLALSVRRLRTMDVP